jgi:hypothetical protein
MWLIGKATIISSRNKWERSPSLDAIQVTEASQINLDESTDNPRPNYARVYLATTNKRHMDPLLISADESELFGAPSDINASPRIKHQRNRPFLQSPSEIQGQRVI